MSYQPPNGFEHVGMPVHLKQTRIAWLSAWLVPNFFVKMNARAKQTSSELARQIVKQLLLAPLPPTSMLKGQLLLARLAVGSSSLNFNIEFGGEGARKSQREDIRLEPCCQGLVARGVSLNIISGRPGKDKLWDGGMSIVSPTVCPKSAFQKFCTRV